MNTRSIAMIAVLAVAAVAIIGAGYAYYWGQTEIADNDVDVRYIAVQTDVEANIDFELDFNTTYSHIDTTIESDDERYYTLKTTPDFVTVLGKNVTPITRDTDGTLKGEAFTLTSPIMPDGFTYQFQVTLENIQIGTNATLWFGYSNNATTAPDAFYKFCPVAEYVANTDIMYVANVPAIALAADSVNGGYSVTKYAFIYLEEADAVTTSNVDSTVYTTDDAKSAAAKGIQVKDVKTAKCEIGGKIAYQAIVESGNSVATDGKVTAANGWTPTVSSDYATLTSSTVTLKNTVAAGTYSIPVKFTHTGGDVQYIIVELTKS